MSPQTFTFDVSLRIRHPHIDPAILTESFTLTPRFKWRAGDARATPDGKPLDGYREETYWCARVATRARGSLTSAIALLLNHLDNCSQIVGSVVSSGGSLEIFVGVYADSYFGETFDAEFLRRIASAPAALAVEVYLSAEGAGPEGPTRSA